MFLKYIKNKNVNISCNQNVFSNTQQKLIEARTNTAIKYCIFYIRI